MQPELRLLDVRVGGARERVAPAPTLVAEEHDGEARIRAGLTQEGDELIDGLVVARTAVGPEDGVHAARAVDDEDDPVGDRAPSPAASRLNAKS